MVGKNAVIATENIEAKILLIRLIRGQKVMLDADLVELYGVSIRALNQAVKRNTERFPEDFMFQLRRYFAITQPVGTQGRRA